MGAEHAAAAEHERNAGTWGTSIHGDVLPAAPRVLPPRDDSLPQTSAEPKGASMADPSDLLTAWQDAIREVGGIAASLVSGPAGLAGDVRSVLQRQTEQLERVLQRQLEFERELVARASAPARAALELVEQATVAYRAQAKAFRAASVSFGQLAELIEQQAELVERASAAIRDPVAALRSAGAEAASIGIPGGPRQRRGRSSGTTKSGRTSKK
jgi:hypothetical protein